MKVCIFCKHFQFHAASPEYGEYTPGVDAAMYCGESHWRVDWYETQQYQLEAYIASAETCKDYERRKKRGV